MKKGQAKQIFIYITALVIFAIILTFGYQAINGILEKGETVAFTRFKTTLDNSVKDIQTQYGSVRVFDGQNQLRLPGSYEQVCFIDVNKNPPSPCPGSNSNLTPIMCDVWETAQEDAEPDGNAYEEASQNVFLKPPAESSIKVENIEIKGRDKNHLCLESQNGLLYLKMKGQGDTTLLSKASRQR